MPKIVCLGEILVDLIACDLDLSWDQVTSWEAMTGGAPANVAFALSRLGLDTAFLGCMGIDKTGQRLFDALQTAGVNTKSIQFSPNLPTREIYVERNHAGERFFAGFGKHDPGDFADTDLSLTSESLALFDSSKAIVTGSLLLAFPNSRLAVQQAVDYCWNNGITTVLDINRRDVFWSDPAEYAPLLVTILPKIHILKFSREEALWLTGTYKPLELSTLFPAARAILVSDGEHGSNWTINGISSYTPAFKVDAIDTTGAGDCFLAGFLFQYFNVEHLPMDMKMATFIMEFASAMGALCATKTGAVTAIPSEQNVLDFMQHSKTGINES